MANGLLITIPNKQAHAALSILKKSRILAPDVIEVGAIKHVMKLIANSLSADDADGTMRLFFWHTDQKAVCRCLTAILDLADDSNSDMSS